MMEDRPDGAMALHENVLGLVRRPLDLGYDKGVDCIMACAISKGNLGDQDPQSGDVRLRGWSLMVGLWNSVRRLSSWPVGASVCRVVLVVIPIHSC